jgi:hypothetical protein
METCTKCGELKFLMFGGISAECHCKEFTIIDEDGEDHKIIANDEHDAARKFAEKSNTNGDYYLMDSTAKITVNGKEFIIGAEPDIHYTVRAV